MSPIVSKRDLLRLYVDREGVKHRLIGIATDLLTEREDNGHRIMWTRRAFEMAPRKTF